MPPSSSSGTCSVSRSSLSGSYSTTQLLPLIVVSNSPRSGSALVFVGLWIFVMTGGAFSSRSACLLERLDLFGAVGAVRIDSLKA